MGAEPRRRSDRGRLARAGRAPEPRRAGGVRLPWAAFAAFAAFAAAVAALATPREAAALPAFARTYAAPCALCHAPAPPALNDMGRRFKEHGYRLDPAADAPYRQAASVIPDSGQRLQLPRDLPLALRAVGSLVAAADPRSAPVVGEAGAATSGGAAGTSEARNPLDFRPFEALYLLAGASVYSSPRAGVSLFVAATLGADPALHHAAIGLHDLGGPDLLNLRFGRFLLLDFGRPEHRFLTRFGNPIATTAVGLNPTVLDSTQHGLALFGRLWQRRLFYHLAVVQGAQGPDGVSDRDGHKDLFAELQLTPHHRLDVGLLGYRGRTQILDQRPGLSVRFTDPFRVAGASARAQLPGAELYALGLYGKHDNPEGTGEHTDYWAYRLEAALPLSPSWFALARYDQLSSHHLPDLKQATFHLGVLALANLRLALESSVPLHDVATATATLLVDLAL